MHARAAARVPSAPASEGSRALLGHLGCAARLATAQTNSAACPCAPNWLQATYAGNRAPFPIFIHIYWLNAADNSEQLQEFVGATRGWRAASGWLGGRGQLRLQGSPAMSQAWPCAFCALPPVQTTPLPSLECSSSPCASCSPGCRCDERRSAGGQPWGLAEQRGASPQARPLPACALVPPNS